MTEPVVAPCRGGMITAMGAVFTASESSWTVPFSGLSSHGFRKLITVLPCDGVDTMRRADPGVFRWRIGSCWSRPTGGPT